MTQEAEQLLQQFLSLPAEDRRHLLLRIMEKVKSDWDGAEDGLGTEERAALDSALSKAWQQAQDGLGRPAAEVLASLRR